MSLVLNLVPCGGRLVLSPAELAFTEKLEAVGRQGKRGVRVRLGKSFLPDVFAWQT